MRSYSFIKSGILALVSEQEIIDCCTRGSGEMIPVFDCIHSIGGLCSPVAYPPTRSVGACKNASCTPVIQVCALTYDIIIILFVFICFIVSNLLHVV